MLTEEKIFQFEDTELEGVLPAIQLVIDRLAEVGEFPLPTKHLTNAAKALYQAVSQK